MFNSAGCYFCLIAIFLAIYNLFFYFYSTKMISTNFFIFLFFFNFEIELICHFKDQFLEFS